MPLPKKLKRGASKKAKKRVVKATLHDLKHGPHHKDRTHKQEVAIAMKQSGQSRRKSSPGSKARNAATKPVPKRKPQNRKSRNKGRH